MAAADAERRQAAILYAELRNFTRLSAVLPPEKVLELANDFFSFCAMAITANKGKVLSVQNDALVAAFAAPQPREFATRALKAARDLQREFGLLGEQWKTQYGLPARVLRRASRRSRVRHGGSDRRAAVRRVRRLRERLRAARAPRARGRGDPVARLHEGARPRRAVARRGGAAALEIAKRPPIRCTASCSTRGSTSPDPFRRLSLSIGRSAYCVLRGGIVHK